MTAPRPKAPISRPPPACSTSAAAPTGSPQRIETRARGLADFHLAKLFGKSRARSAGHGLRANARTNHALGSKVSASPIHPTRCSQTQPELLERHPTA